jgi:hypothetical protein
MLLVRILILLLSETMEERAGRRDPAGQLMVCGVQ